MTVAVDIVVADAQATPVSHTFVPLGRDPAGVMWFEDRSAANSVGFWRISIDDSKMPTPQKAGRSSDRAYRTTVGIHFPVLEVQGPGAAPFVPAPTVAYIPRVFVEFIDPERSTLANRQDVAKMVPLILQNAQVKAVIETHSRLS